MSSSTAHHQAITSHHAVPTISSTPVSHVSNTLITTRQQPTSIQQSDNRLQPTESSETMVRHHTENMSPDRHLQHSETNRQIQNNIQTANYQNPYPGGFSQQGYNTSGQVKPYRPWGAEVAY